MSGVLAAAGFDKVVWHAPDESGYHQPTVTACAVWCRELLEQLIAKHTGQPLETVAKDTDRDFILTAEEAIVYGVIDEVITSRKISPQLAALAGEEPRASAASPRR